MTKKERINYLDMARGIGMILVVIGHISYVAEPIRNYITAFHMPLFFLISGILIQYKGEEKAAFSVTFRKKVKSLMLPYLIFSVLYFFIESVRLIIRDLDEWNVVFRQVWQSFCLQGVSALWFLPALFFGEVIFVWIRKHFGHIFTAICLLLFVGIAYFADGYASGFFETHISLGYSLLEDFVSMIIRSIFCVGLVGFGYYLSTLFINRKITVLLEAVSSVLLFVLLGVLVKYNAPVDLRAMELGNPVLFLAGGIIGSAGVILMCRVISGISLRPLHSVLEYFGRNSLWIMATHIEFRVLYLAILLAAFLNSIFENNALFCFFIVLFVFLMEIVVIEIINRILRFLNKKSKIS